jgi:hypothetical protein
VELRSGTRLFSAVCETNVIVVKPPAKAGEICCGGMPMVASKPSAMSEAGPAADASGGTVLGKRYACDGEDLVVLCTKSGAGSLAFGDRPLTEQGAKPLPPSD